MNPSLSDRLAAALPWAQSLLLLAFRLIVAKAFLLSGLTKIRDWDTTLALFANEYHVPILPPDLAAWLGTGGELGLPILLGFGLAGRFGAAGLFFMNIVAVVSYPDLAPAALKDHWSWALMLATVMVFGSGRLSIDALLAHRWQRWLRLRAPAQV